MTVQPLILHPFQLENIEALRTHARAGLRAVILNSPTGSGKSICAIHLIQEALAKGSRVVFCVERLTLLDQFSVLLDRYGVDHGVLGGNHWRKRPGQQVQVVSAQTISKRGWPPCDLLIVDESHLIYRVVMDKIKARDCMVIGLTATAMTRGLGKYYQAVVNVRTTNKLVEEKFLVPFRIFAHSEPDMTGAATGIGGEWTDEAACERAMPIIGNVVSTYLSHGEGRKFIGFGVDVRHCEEMRRQFLAAGVMVELFTYHTNEKARVEIMTEFRKPDSRIRGLLSVSALSRGLDCPDVSAIISARPLRTSLAEFIQVIGRGLRTYPEKSSCILFDHGGNALRHWDDLQYFLANGVTELDDGSKKQAKKRDPKEKKPRKCPTCFCVHAPAPCCPQCGYEWPRKPSVQHLPGELRELSGAHNGSRGDEALFYGELLWFVQQRGYKPGWAKHKFHSRYGRWPGNYKIDPIEPSAETRSFVRKQAVAWSKSQKMAEVAA